MSSLRVRSDLLRLIVVEVSLNELFAGYDWP